MTISPDANNPQLLRFAKTPTSVLGHAAKVGITHSVGGPPTRVVDFPDLHVMVSIRGYDLALASEILASIGFA